jgi:choline dehydrogenase-like flavoprotein
LINTPDNLTIVTNSPASQILFDGKKAIGVVAGGKEYYAENEIILSAGALDTPKLLLLSGVGPKEELSKHGISTVVNLPVGQGLQDHVHIGITMQVKDGCNDRTAWSAPEAMKVAREQFNKDGTGPFRTLNASAIVGFFKGSEKLLASQEFADLPAEVQEHIKKPTVPTWELATLCPPLTPHADPTLTYFTVVAFGMVPQSRGTVTLKSTNPADPPLCDPNILSHPFDKINMIDTVRQCCDLLASPSLAKDVVKPFIAPKSNSDEDIWQFIQEHCNSTYHMSCSTKMGKAEDEDTVVTSDFVVKGLQGLRIADVGITPFLPNCHTVSTAYLIGESASEKLIAEHGLEG